MLVGIIEGRDVGTEEGFLVWSTVTTLDVTTVVFGILVAKLTVNVSEVS